ncbi:CHASE2 domain-containing protein [Treponema sp.]|uniref:CHASE2 domain-containing protein n=1 Tax=Treponema sp. TaxID=166 RepID=UPI0038909FC5
MKIKGKIRQILLSCFILIVLTCVLYVLNVFKWAENKSYDSRMKFISRSTECSEQIALVLLDQESLDWAKNELGWSWPWPRKAYAEMVDYFSSGKAACVSFDMIYSEPSVYGEEDDNQFAESSRKFGKVIQTAFYENENSTVPTLPVPVLKESAFTLGDVSSTLDKTDKIARRSQIDKVKNRNEYGLSAASFLVNNEESCLEEIPRAKEGGMYVRYVNDLSRFAPYNAKQILQSAAKIKNGVVSGSDEDFIPPEQFSGNYVFFGLYAPGLFDICATPVSSTYPGVGVHLCQLNTILQKNYLKDWPEFLNFILVIAAVLSAFLLGSSISQARISSLLVKTLFAFTLLFTYFTVSYYVFDSGYILPVVPVLFSFILAYITAIFEGYMTEGRQKRYIKSAFRQYLSPAVIENLIENPEKLNLGGEEREITAYFSDVQGFTSISEKLSPKELTDLLNNYLSAMTDIILEHGGTIDKYEGDAIIAFWGAPSEQKDHAKRAVETALACQEKLSQMQEELTRVTGKPFVQRIGLNTGKAVVGNMGSRSRFDYTMMGDTVNLASRLEGINKQFGTYTMCSRATMQGALENGAECSFRQIAKIAVVGKNEGVDVFVPLKADEFEKYLEIRRVYDEAYSLFVNGEFEKAKSIFEIIKDKDAPALKFIEKCGALIKNPPASWDGILRATEK